MRAIFHTYAPNLATLQPDLKYHSLRLQQSCPLHPSSILSQTMPRWLVYDRVGQIPGGFELIDAS